MCQYSRFRKQGKLGVLEQERIGGTIKQVPLNPDRSFKSEIHARYSPSRDRD